MNNAAQNSTLATINEILTGYYINGEKWYGNAVVKETFRMKKAAVTAEEYQIQDGRAQKMADVFIAKASDYGFKSVVTVYWTARPGQVSKIVDPQNQLDMRFNQNPSDLIVKFRDVPYSAGQYLGLSAKSTTGRKGALIGFKNPGLGSIERDLHVDLRAIVEKGVEKLRKEYRLSEVATRRRMEITTKPRVKKYADRVGDDVLEEIRDRVFSKMSHMQPKNLRIYLIKEWLDADELYPPYFKVTGSGNQAPYRANIEDPRNNEKLEAINTQKLNLKKAERHSIQVLAGKVKLFNIRAKFDKQKLAGSVVFSADPL